MRIYGNKHALERLSEHKLSGRLPHALLLFGDKGTGKRLLADYTAMLHFCKSGGDVPCGQCSSCTRIEQHIHPDVIYIDCGETSVGKLRELLKASYGLPVEGELRIYVMNEFQLFGRECQNTLLTFLEEPSAHTRFILTASNRSSILPTILSRTALIQTEPLTVAECVQALSEYGHSEEADNLAAMYGGNLGMALKALSEKNATLYLNAAREYVSALCNGEEYTALTIMHHLPQPKEDKRGPVRELVLAAQKLLHDAFVFAGGGEGTSSCDRELAKRLADSYDISVLSSFCAEAERFSVTVSEVNFNSKITANAFTAALFAAADKNTKICLKG